MRGTVLEAFPAEPGRPRDADACLAQIDRRYADDAYHSLSIEGYGVTAQLIEQIAHEDEDPNEHIADAQPHDVMAAYGYWRAHNVVRRSLRRIIAGENAGAVARDAHREWFLQLFSTSVDAGIVDAADLEVYRLHRARITGALHVPPLPAEVPAMMSALFDCLEAEPSAAVRAVLGHFVFVYIHPYMDGTGRMARFLMNTMLVSGGYPWTVLRVDERDEYMGALASASSSRDIAPFARFVAQNTNR